MVNTIFYEGAKIKLLPNRLVNLRKKKGETQEQTAKNLGLTRSAYSQYEIGTRKPDPETLVKIAEYFDESTDYLLGRDNIIQESKEAYLSEDEQKVLDAFRNLDDSDKKYIADLMTRIKKK